jgi:hypothetical protein
VADPRRCTTFRRAAFLKGILQTKRQEAIDTLRSIRAKRAPPRIA